MVNKNEMAARGESTVSVEPHYNTLLEWAQKFVDMQSANKSFILQREFPNWDTQLLEGRIRTLLASLVSKGDVEDITDIKLAFSATHTHVIVTPPHTSVMNKFLSFVKANRNFAVVKAVWPYANTAKETRNDVPRQCAVQSEDGWWQMWGPIIAMAVKTRKSGWLGVENVMDMVMNSRIQRSTC